MDEKRINEWLKAINTLEKYYSKFKLDEHPGLLNSCPLCEIVNGNCYNCLWIIYPLDKDLNLSNEELTLYTCYSVKNHTIKWSLDRLRKWKELLLKKMDEYCIKNQKN